VWPVGIMVRVLDLQLQRLRVRLSAIPLSSNNLGKLFTHVPLTPNSINLHRLTSVKKKKDSHREQRPLHGSSSPIWFFEPVTVVRPN